MAKRGKYGIRLYKTAAARRSAVTQMADRYNYFVGFREADTQNPAGLSFGVADWLHDGQIYCKDVYYRGDHIVH